MFRSTPPLQEHLRPVAVRDRPQADVDGYLDAVERRLRSLFGEQRVRWQHRYPQLGVGFDAVESFVLNGGKRLRPRFAYWGWVGAGGLRRPAPNPIDAPPVAWSTPLVELGAAIELFHAFALIHDDVMDGSATRRHQPTVHHRFAALHGEAGWRGESRRTAEGFAILLGDLAFAWSSHLLVALPAPVAALFDEMRIELHMGQYLDLFCAATGDDDPATAADVVRFKTAAYSVQRPLQLGTALAACGATAPTAPGSDGEPLDRCWTAYGLAVGEAFQHRDDLLGVFGDTAVTGKPVGDDLQAGKNTLLLQRTLAAAGAGSLEVLGGIGSGELRPQDIEVIGTFMRDCGAVDAVERRIARLVCEAVAAVEAAPLEPEAADGLCSLARAAAWRAQ